MVNNGMTNHNGVENDDSGSIRKNLEEAILVQARLIAQLKLEVQRLKMPESEAKNKREAIKH